MSIFSADENETKVTLEEERTPLSEDTPFRLLLIGDWSGRGSHFSFSGSNQSSLKPIEIDRDNFEEIIQKLNAEILLDLNGDGKEVLRLRFGEMDDFHPDKIFYQVPLFDQLRETRRELMNPHTFNQAMRKIRPLSSEAITEESEEGFIRSAESEKQPPAADNLLEQILSESEEGSNQKQSRAASSDNLDNLISRLVKPYLVEVDETEQAKSVAAVDEATGQLMRMILHHPRFQALESAWRGIELLVSRVETGSNLKLYLLDLTKDELAADIQSVGDLSESVFYKLLNNESFDESDDQPWALICSNYTFEPSVEDTAALMRIAKIAQSSNTSFIAQAGPQILGVEFLSETLESNRWGLSEDEPEGKLWSMLRDQVEACYVGLTVNQFLGRMPYGAKSNPTETFSFEELLNPNNQNDYLWVNSSFACALLMAQSFCLYEWEIEGNLLLDIEGLPLYMYKDAGQTIVKPPVEAALNLSAAQKIIEQGLMPFVSFRDSDSIRLASFQSIASFHRKLCGRWSS